MFDILSLSLSYKIASLYDKGKELSRTLYAVYIIVTTLLKNMLHYYYQHVQQFE